MHLLLATPGGTGLYLSFNTMSWLFVAVLISLGCFQAAKHKSIYFQQYHLWLLLGCLLLAVPFFYNSPFKDHNILRYLGVIAGIMLLLACYQFPTLKLRRRLILWLILIAVVIQALVTLYQFVFAQYWPLDWFNHTVSRPFGLFLQPNSTAIFLATGIAISFYQLAKYPFIKRNVFLLTAIVGLAAFLIPATRSLAGLIALILVVALTFPLLYRRNKKIAMMQIAVIIIAICSAKAIQTPEADKPDRNVNLRKDIYAVSLQMITAKPLSGYGYGSFERSYLDFHNALRVKDPSINPPLLKLDHPHNEIFYWGIEGGLVSLLGLLSFVIGYCSLFKARINLKHLALLGLVTPISFHSLVELPFDSVASNWHILLFLLFYTSNELKLKTKQLPLPSAFSPTIIGLLTFGIFVPFLITTLHTTSIVIAHEASHHQKIDSFKQIINPLPLRERINANINAHKLIIGFKEKDAKTLQQYIDWAKVRIRHKPRISVYKNLLLCLSILGQNDLYQKILKEAKNTYPDEKDWLNSILTEHKKTEQ